MSLENPAFFANGTIDVSRFVKLDTTKEFHVLEASAASDPIIGISQAGSRDAPGTIGAGVEAARAGDPIKIFGPGTVCLLKVKGDLVAIAIGDFLTAGVEGKGVKAVATNNVGAIALQPASADDVLIRVLVTLGIRG